jgi:thiol-disulfide isomerase/thioredoxin
VRRKPTLITVACICVVVRFAQADVLTIGSPAPELTLEKFVQGTTVSKLQRGQKYVIEFSGTKCAPCIQFIPLIEDLKNKHKQFTFISVFSEAEDEVRTFLKGAGADMSTYVACDSTGAVDQLWMQKAGVRGIPFVFVVNEDLNIAWMGSPEGLGTVLPILAKQKTVSPEEYMRVTLVQHATLRETRANERWEEAQLYRRETIIRLVNEGLHAQAIEAIDKAIETYRDLPDVVDDLRTFKLSEMARVPGTRDAAGTLALEIAADYYNNNDSGCAGTLIQHYEAALPENKNRDVVLLALTLLQETPIPSNDADADDELSIRRNHFSALAEAHHLLDRPKEAVKALHTAISFAETQLRERRKNGYHKLHIANAARQLAKLRERLAMYNERPIAAEQSIEPKPTVQSN